MEWVDASSQDRSLDVYLWVDFDKAEKHTSHKDLKSS